ncbi:MAG TPA: alpha/beta hydrolase [Gemmatimonadaceae bacterium]|nr:alpha/beta hydrolase [Gemmatimonadaceae bacterium]
MVTIFLLAVAVALGAVVISTLWLWRVQERVVFQPPAVAVVASAPARRVELAASDGHPLIGYVVAPPLPAPGDRPVVLMFHGNADLAAWQVPWARELANRTGATVFLAEYRGYAGLEGHPTYENVASDAQGALQFVQTRLHPSRIVLFGHSLGSAVATELAAAMQSGPGNDAASALVLQSPFTSAREMAARMLVPPVQWLWQRISRVHYDTRALVQQLDCPVFVSHGTRDVVIPTRMGRSVFAVARHPARLLIVEGAGHNDVAEIGGEQYWQWLVSAVRSEGSTPVRELEKEGHRRLP